MLGLCLFAAIHCLLDDPTGPGYGEFKTDYESIFVRMARSGAKTRSLVVDHGNPSVMHGAKASSCVGVKTDQEVVDAIGEGMGSHGFVFGRLSGVAEVCGCKCNFLGRACFCVLVAERRPRRTKRKETKRRET
jgi:hypothetical protein